MVVEHWFLHRSSSALGAGKASQRASVILEFLDLIAENIVLWIRRRSIVTHCAQNPAGRHLIAATGDKICRGDTSWPGELSVRAGCFLEHAGEWTSGRTGTVGETRRQKRRSPKHLPDTWRGCGNVRGSVFPLRCARTNTAGARL